MSTPTPPGTEPPGWPPSDRQGCGADGWGERAPDLAGTVRAIRSWGIDDDGWLRGHVYPALWSTEWNTAGCLRLRPKPAADPFAGLRLRVASSSPSHRQLTVRGWDFAQNPPQMLGQYVGTPCSGLEPGCECGFFAYTDTGRRWEGQTTWNSSRHIEGVVEAAGVLVVGPYGIRAEMARIIALVEPPILKTCNREISRLRVKLDVAEASEPPPVPPIWARSRRQRIRHERLAAIARSTNLKEVLDKHLNLYDELAKRMQQVRQRYPNVAMFKSRDAMLQHFPVQPLDHLLKPPLKAA